ncbi:MAG: hypothetical protein D4R67_10300 [Bacteroidetes bacterium]|nr:MAG: hypothetical protein D4R67_10300 [Bacteroidota bacterium]
MNGVRGPFVIKLVIAGKASADQGVVIFNSHCKTCHGKEAKGGVAIGFNNPDFFRASSLEYIFNTVTRGRMNTAMPSWSMLADREMADLLEYIESLGVEGSGSKFKGRGSRVEANFDFRISNFKFPVIRHPASVSLREAKRRSSGIRHPALNASTTSVPAVMESMGKEPRGRRSCIDTTWEYNFAGPTLGNKIRGTELFAYRCAECHGTHGTGLKAPSLNDQLFLNAATNGFLLATITLGRPGTEMPL